MPKLSKVDLVLANLDAQIAELQRSRELIMGAANAVRQAKQVRVRKSKTVVADLGLTRPAKQTRVHRVAVDLGPAPEKETS